MFQDLKILELASVLAGPLVGQFFAELGGSVIKVENIRTNGDVTRSWKSESEKTDERSAYFTAINWGKRSIAIDLATVDGRDIIYQLVLQSDIVVASYKPGDAEKLGVDYKSIVALKHDIIYAQISGYGPHDQRVGYDAVIQAEAGFMYMNGEPGQMPLKMPVALIDILAAHQLKEGLLVALIRRMQSGEGALVQVSLLQAAIASLANQATNWLVGGTIPRKQGSAHPNIAPYGDVFRTASGDDILLAVGTDGQFQNLCKTIGIQSIAADPRFVSNAGRVTCRDDLHAAMAGPISTFTTDELIESLNRANVPVGIVRNMKQVFDMPAAAQMLVFSADRTGVKTFVADPFSDDRPGLTPPPAFGEHSIEILTSDLKIDPEFTKNLLERGIVK